MARPRSAECDRAILDAALYEYAHRGLEGMSVDAVAARAGVSKATIYRRFPSKVELVVAALFEVIEEAAPKSDTGNLRDDLTIGLRNLRKLLSEPVLGAVSRMLVADSQTNVELARMHAEFVDHRRAGTREQLRRAIDRNELEPDTDLETAMDMLVGPIFYCHLVRHARVTDAHIDTIVDSLIARYGVRQIEPA